MSFKKFKSDVSTAAQKVATGAVAGVLSVGAGDSDGEVVITYRHDSLPADLKIQALAQDLSEYPDGNMFMLWIADDCDLLQPVLTAIKATQDYLLGLSVYEMVIEVASRIRKELGQSKQDGDGKESHADAEADEHEDHDFDNFDDADDDSQFSIENGFGLTPWTSEPVSEQSTLSEHQQRVLSRIRRDLRQVKHAGYKVGFLDGFGQTSILGHVSISIRVDKLALSDEAMEAWGVNPGEYIVLLLRFEKGYIPLERVLELPASQTDIKFRIGKSKRHKPSLAQALAAFVEATQTMPTANADIGGEDLDSLSDNFEKLFISNSLDDFLNGSFISLLKLRRSLGVDWEKANESLLQKILQLPAKEVLSDSAEAKNCSGGPPGFNIDQGRHRVLASDHLIESGPADEHSLPLIAVQFAMRYFVKCTEYCLRCHRRLEKGFQALRPYVCSTPLCLFQYMAMGFGPSIEHEILTEPYVVDLLVSLCYAAIQPYYSLASRLPASNPPAPKPSLPIRSLPAGLKLQVPHLSNPEPKSLTAQLVGDSLLFEHEDARKLAERLAPARWVAFRKPPSQPSITQHARIVEIDYDAKRAVVEIMGESAAHWTADSPNNKGADQPHARSRQAEKMEDGDYCDVFPYDTDFDSLDESDKGIAMRHILDTLPSILEMKDWLTSHPGSRIRSMERISPAAESLLNWIVSSNRSCIFQVGGSQDAMSNLLPEPAGKARGREHEWIPGLDGWMQFRFAQGSPDKELRFNRALKEVAETKSLGAHPTILAWHGSNLANWHSIVRTGLDYQDIRSGRAYGHGVYFSRHFSTSIGYTGSAQYWPNSDLKLINCLSLNEIINAPEKFVSKDPHYVVSQLDWHQCRYLFVQTSRTVKGPTKQPSAKIADSRALYPQAPGFEVYGPSNQILKIPLSAIPPRTIGLGGVKTLGPSKRPIQRLEDSDDEDAEDISLLLSDDEFNACRNPPGKKSASRASSLDTEVTRERCIIPCDPVLLKKLTHDQRGGARPPTPASVDRSLTDFEPGTLDLTTLPRLGAPSFATDAAGRVLSRELRKLQSIQAKTALHELGWYMDFDQVTNLFQWIVELHSFDPALPLAQDMKRTGITSIVVEVRFGANFPLSPPFVRVIRPRFLPFAMGGGGHVTAGGAMCMQLLTDSGWSPAYSMESVLLEVRLALCNPEPRPARLQNATQKNVAPLDYGVEEAIEAYIRAARSHNWKVPAGLRQTASGV